MARREVLRTAQYEVHVVGAPRPALRDLYHALLRAPWWATLLLLVLGWTALNALFAGLFLLTGGVTGAEPGSFLDAFFFSVQTMGTVGYGAMYPATRAANAVVVVESVTGLVVTALATGLVFAKFAQTRARVVFARKVAICRHDGVPTLLARLGNERAGEIVDVSLRATLVRTTRTAEGRTFYRSVDLPLVRSHLGGLSRAWTLMHVIDEASPLRGETAASLEACEAELTVVVSGVDDTSLQSVHAKKTWHANELCFGMRPADIVSETDDGNIQVDLRRFHDLEPADEP